MVLVAITDYYDRPILSALFPGDAVALTFRAFLDLKVGEEDSPPPARFQFNREVKYISVAHHGARKHLFEDDAQKAVYRAYLNNYTPSCASASAAYYAGFGHPHAEVCQKYYNHADRNVSLHSISTNGVIKSLSTLHVSEDGYSRQFCNTRFYTTHVISCPVSTGRFAGEMFCNISTYYLSIIGTVGFDSCAYNEIPPDPKRERTVAAINV